MKKFKVTYRYLATGMEGKADVQEYGVVEATDEMTAKRHIANGLITTNLEDKNFFLGCLSAVEVKETSPKHIIERLESALRKESLNSYSYVVLKEALDFIKGLK